MHGTAGPIILAILGLAVHAPEAALGQSRAAEAADWAQFRGPGGLAVKADSDPPITWSADQNILWKAELPGSGASSPVIAGDRIFLTAYSGYSGGGRDAGSQEDLRRLVVCLGREDGKVIWTRAVKSKLPEEERIREGHGYASSTPAAGGDRVYAFFGKSGVHAFGRDGRELWSADVGSGTSGWGSAASPVLHRGLVIINASVESESLVALRQESGEAVWRAEGIQEAWNTPLLVEAAPGKLELVVGVPRRLLAFDPDDGKPLWSCEHGINWYICPSAVARDGVVYLTGGRSGGGSVAVRAGGRGDVTASRLVWKLGKGTNVPSPIIHDGYLYFAHDNLGILYCVNAGSGEVVYEQRLEPSPGQIYASPVLAGGRLYYLSRSGRALVVAARPEFEVLARNSFSGDRGVFNASPALSGDRLLVRSDRFLYCIGRK